MLRDESQIKYESSIFKMIYPHLNTDQHAFTMAFCEISNNITGDENIALQFKISSIVKNNGLSVASLPGKYICLYRNSEKIDEVILE
jgi:hypothetical protein